MVMMSDGTLWECTETLLVSEKYRIFVLTGQPGIEGGRKAFFSVRPFGSFDADDIAAMKAKSLDADNPTGSVSIKPNRDHIEIAHLSTRTSTLFPVASLDAEVRTRLENESSKSWEKDLQPKKPVVATGAHISVRKPLQVRNTP